MNIEIKVPSLGESESEATLVAWQKHAGDSVAEDDVLAEIESDKITMEVTATASGTLLEVRKRDGDTVEPGEIIGLIEAGELAARAAKKAKPLAAKKVESVKAVVAEEPKEKHGVEAALTA
ncbi:MAG: biotin/lipoyl-containing protein, partial [Mariprofundaceae bacterium]|nr:biotin/lipoyl-containing protein [Mariprofundaceae bacterium]